MMRPGLNGILVLAVLGTACFGGSRQTAAPPQEPPDSVVVATVNENFYDARVHAVYDGGKRRTLGTIPGNGGRSQMLLAWEPRALVFEISFVISGAAYVSHPVDVVPGERVEVRLPANIEESGFFRRVTR